MRIVLTADDLARVRISPAADPLWELMHSIHMAGSKSAEVLFGRWRHRCRRQPADRLDLLTSLAPPQGYSPDFLTPAGGTADLEAGIESVLSTPRDMVRGNLGRLASERRSRPAWMSELARGHPSAMRDLGHLLRCYFDTALAPYWPYVRRQINEEMLRGRTAMATRGVEHLLPTVSPLMRWEAPTLILNSKHIERDIHLDGRGLVLQPSFFAYADVTILRVPDMPVVLAYPVEQPLGWCSVGDAGTTPARRLDSLIGRTRSRALDVLAGGECTTSGLASRLGVSIPSASQQARVLRDAGLVISDQRGKAVVHRASTLGLTLLDATAVR